MRSGFIRRLLASVVLGLGALGLAACDSSRSGGGVDSVSGSVSGLAKGESVVLELNGAGTLTVSSSGTFAFPNGVSTNGNYAVTIASQPRGQVCTVANGTGAGITSNVTNVAVSCAAQTFTVGGTLTGLAAGSQVVLENHGADALTLTADGSFSFSTKVAFDGTYAVTVATEPSGATCSVLHGTGAGVTGEVASIAVTCSPNTFTLSGTLSGLTSGMQVTLENNSADPLTLSANGPFTFSVPVAEFGSYNVTVSAEPAGQTCTVTNFQGTQVTRNVSNITVSCSTNTYTVGGSVSGLGVGQQVTLEDNGGDSLTVTGNGPFVFATSLTYGSAYNVTVGTQPAGGLVCLVSNGAASSITADVTAVDINCVANTVSFTTPGSYTWTVPAGVTSISIVATGGGGGGGGATLGGGGGAGGGAGAIVTSTLSVTPGQVLSLVVGGGGQGGTSPPACGTGGGGGGSTNVDAGASDQIIAGGGGGGGPSGCAGSTGGSAGGVGGAGGNGGGNFVAGGGGGSGGIGGAGGGSYPGGPPFGNGGGNGDGGAGGAGGYNGPYAGGTGGSGVGSGSGGNSPGDMGGGGGGGYGGGGSGGIATGGGAGGSTGPSGTTYAPASNGGGSATNGGDGSIVITLQ